MESYADFEFSGYHWKVRSDLAEILRDEVIPLVLSGNESPRLHVVGRKHTRDSFIVSTDGAAGDIFVKFHKYEKLRDRFKAIFLASRARAEFSIGVQMLASGLPVSEPLGWGERREYGLVTGCVLIVRALPDCDRLSGYLYREYHRKDLSSSDEGDEFLASLGALVRQMHSAGFRHPDLHSANVLVDSNVSPPKLWLVDLHSAAGPSPVSTRRRMADLAKLIFSLRGFLKESQLLEILEGYEPDAAPDEIKEMLSRLYEAAKALKKRRVKSRSKRCMKTSGNFVVEKIGKNKLYRRREFEADAVLELVNRHSEIHAGKGPGLVKATSKSALTRFPPPGAWGGNIYVKQFKNAGMIRFLETVFSTHRGKRAWKAGHLLYWLGVPCAEPVALVEQNGLGTPRTSYLIMKEIPDAMRLNAFLLREYFRVSGRLAPEETAAKRRLIRAGARALSRFHSKNIYHKDLSAKNILVSLGEDGGPRFYCVDTDSVQFPLRLSLRRRIKNLAQLNGLPSCLTSADRIRFYKEYFGLQALTPFHKFIIRRILISSRSRIIRSKRVDEQVRKNPPLDEQAYEDITSV